MIGLPLIFCLDSASEENAEQQAIDAAYLTSEGPIVASLLHQARLDPASRARVLERAINLVQAVRARKADQGALEAFMQEYDLSSGGRGGSDVAWPKHCCGFRTMITAEKADCRQAGRCRLGIPPGAEFLGSCECRYLGTDADGQAL